MERSKPKIRRCAVYTRKSSEEGLEQGVVGRSHVGRFTCC
jgi:hypothetical protein